jgi:hypothetical protein
VNIVDLIEWGRKQDADAKRVWVFPSTNKLRNYCLETGKIFRNDLDGSCVLRHLLRRFFFKGKTPHLTLVGP